MRKRQSNPRTNPPPITGLRPPFVKEDEWLTYSFGYDPKETDDWIVPRNSQDTENLPLWIGSTCRSLFLPKSAPFQRALTGSCRFYNFRLAWQDPDHPLLMHYLGGFQIDRRYWDQRENHSSLYNSIRFRCNRRTVFVSLAFEKEYEIGPLGNAGCTAAPCEISPFFAEKILGKTKGEILVRFLHNDLKENRDARRAEMEKLPDYRKTPRARRDFFLSHAWDNDASEQYPYSQLKQRLGMYNLPH